MRSMKIVFALCFAAVALPGLAAEKAVPGPEQFKGTERRWLEKGLPAKRVAEEMSIYAKNISNGQNGKPLPFSMMMVYRSAIARYDKYYFFEADTGYSRDWLKRMDNFLEVLINARRKLSSMEANKKDKSKMYRDWDKHFKDNAKLFTTLVKRPIMANPAAVNAAVKKKNALLAEIARQKAAQDKQLQKASKAKLKK